MSGAVYGISNAETRARRRAEGFTTPPACRKRTHPPLLRQGGEKSSNSPPCLRRGGRPRLLRTDGVVETHLKSWRPYPGFSTRSVFHRSRAYTWNSYLLYPRQHYKILSTASFR